MNLYNFDRDFKSVLERGIILLTPFPQEGYKPLNPFPVHLKRWLMYEASLLKRNLPESFKHSPIKEIVLSAVLLVLLCTPLTASLKWPLTFLCLCQPLGILFFINQLSELGHSVKTLQTKGTKTINHLTTRTSWVVQVGQANCPWLDPCLVGLGTGRDVETEAHWIM